MAAATWSLLNQNIEESKPKIVSRSTAPQATVLYEKVIELPKINTRAKRQLRHLLLGTINHANFKVVKAIPVALDNRGTTKIARWKEIDEFGTGKSTSSALDDLGHTIADLYESLEIDEAKLGPDLLRISVILREHVARRPR
jgi:hypothetical protein